MRLTKTLSNLATAFFTSGFLTGAANAESRWENYLDVSQLSDAARPKVVETLDWLEKYYGGFHEILWDLKDRQAAGTLNGKIIMKTDDSAYYKRKDATLGLDYDPAPDAVTNTPYYLGVDGNFYAFSLNETIVHELQHAAQERKLNAQRRTKIEDALREENGKKLKPLKDFLESRGVPDPFKDGKIDRTFDFSKCVANDYILVYGKSDKPDCNPAIFNDPQYQKLHEEFFQQRLKLEDFEFEEEQDAMDMADGLSGTLGKPARGHYHDTNLFYVYILNTGTKSDVAYTQSPAEIRRQNNIMMAGPKEYDVYPLISRDIKVTFMTIKDMQCGWTNTYNANTKNIRTDGWIRINDVKLAFFQSRDYDSLKKSDRVTYDSMIKKMTARENTVRPEICPAP